MSVLVVGGAGFIGSHLVDELLTQGMDVLVVDDLSTGKLENLARWKGHRKLEFVKSDAWDKITMHRMVDHRDWVFNFAPIEFDQLCDLYGECAKADVKRIIDDTGTGAPGEREEPSYELRRADGMLTTTFASLQLSGVYGPRGPHEGNWFVSDVVRANMVVAMDRSYKGVFPLEKVVYWVPVNAKGGQQIIELYEKNSKPSLVIVSR